jgi:formylglycine-generating enzyme required for sulfatase activity
MKIMSKITGFILLFTIFFSKVTAQTEPQMVFVKGGTFMMGSEKGDSDETPVHKVTLSNYYISIYEITVAQYNEYCKATGKGLPAFPSEEWYQEHDKAKKWEWKDNNPITYLTWKDASDYCVWLSKSTGKNYSLPTESQWEFSARGGTLSKNFKFSGSDNINEVSWYDETTYERGPMPVGRLKPNELGIYDMSGNAWEWCSDYYAKYKAGVFKDPIGAPKSLYKVVRGGSWYYVDKMCSVTSRDGPYSNYTNYNYGFRVVINP